MKIYISIALFFVTVFSFAQTPQLIEKRLVAGFNKITYWGSGHEYAEDVNANDSLLKYNDLFEAELLKYTAISSTLNYTFKKLAAAGVVITTSDDGLFRVYSWNTLTGGTMRNYSNVFQYKGNNKMYTKAGNNDEDAGSYYLKIFTVKTNDKTYYLGVNQAILSTMDFYQTVKVFSIDGNTLNDTVKLIKTTSGLQNELGFEYNFFSMKKNKAVDELTTYNKEKKTLTIPVVQEDLKLTSKIIIYSFTGKYFEKLK